MKTLLKYVIVFLSIFILLVFARSAHWVYGLFKRVNFDEIAIVLSSGTAAGSDPWLFWSFMNDVVFLALGIAVGLTFVCYIFRNRKYVMPCIYVLCIGLLGYELCVSNVQFGSFINFQKSNFYESEYVDAKDVNISWAKKRNVLFIALESMERAYSNPSVDWGDGLLLTPEIGMLERSHASFLNYHSVAGLTHTIAAITGFTTGLPLFHTRFRKIEKMLGVSDGLGTIMLNNGYQTWSMFPASGSFSLKSSFMKRMGFNNVIDGPQIYAELENPPTERPFGGIDDGTFFDWAKPKIVDIIKSEKPYFIFMETINTHLEGYFTDYCRNLGFPQETMADITRCDDRIIGDFVRWFRTVDPDAVVILVNDHNQTAGDLMKTLQHIPNRPLANVFINTHIFDGANMNRPVSALDFFPTVLEAAGAVIDGCRLGLGVSLATRCQDVKTLRERYDDIELGQKLEQKNDLYFYLNTGTRR